MQDMLGNKPTSALHLKIKRLPCMFPPAFLLHPHEER